MKETVPIARYIARHNGLYPTEPLDAWRNDWIIEQWADTLKYFEFIFSFGKAKKERAEYLDKNFPEFLNKIKPFTSNRGWLIGDGSEI